MSLEVIAGLREKGLSREDILRVANRIPDLLADPLLLPSWSCPPPTSQQPDLLFELSNPDAYTTNVADNISSNEPVENHFFEASPIPASSSQERHLPPSQVAPGTLTPIDPNAFPTSFLQVSENDLEFLPPQSHHEFPGQLGSISQFPNAGQSSLGPAESCLLAFDLPFSPSQCLCCSNIAVEGTPLCENCRSMLSPAID